MKKHDFKDLRLSGFVKWFHHLVLFITYPFRHFYIFFSVLLLALIFIIGIPLLHDIPLKQIPSWYEDLFSSELPAQVRRIMAKPKQISLKKFKKEIKLHHAAPEQAQVVIQPEDNEPEPEIIREPTKYPHWDIKHEKSPDVVLTPSAKEEEDTVQKPEDTTPQPQNVVLNQVAPVVEQKPSQKLQYRKLGDLSLIYLPTPRRVSGDVIIYGANELYVDDTYLYLYGIYTNPKSYDVNKARAYLRDMIAGKTVVCYVVAETMKGVATAICFADEKNINQSMVDAELADNVAL